MLNHEEYLLTILAEECAEVAQRAAKVLRFGWEETEPGKIQDNRTRLEGELADLLGVYQTMVLQKLVRPIPEDAIFRKHLRINEYLKYSQQLGCVAPTPVAVPDLAGDADQATLAKVAWCQHRRAELDQQEAELKKVLNTIPFVF